MTDENNQNDDLQEKIKAAQKAAEEKENSATQNSQAQDEDELSKIKQELEQMTDIAKRTMADLVNVKRRYEEERIQTITLANLDLMGNLVPILDNLQRAKQHVPDAATEWFKGIEICINQLEQTLISAGLRPIQALNQKFNPEFHQALVQGPGEKDIVIEELEKGYTLGNRVLRHSKVKVGDGS
ncbi:MAG: nucleotide exchange factor GrpE [Patescibacteria group bacterium]